jgi:hypothetical protein
MLETGPDPVFASESASGLDRGQAQISLDVQGHGKLSYHDFILTGMLDCWQLFKSIPGWQSKGYRLVLELLSADEESTRLGIDTNLTQSYEEQWQAAGRAMADLLELPTDQRQLVERSCARGSIHQEFAHQTGFSETFLTRSLDPWRCKAITAPGETDQVPPLSCPAAMKRLPGFRRIYGNRSLNARLQQNQPEVHSTSALTGSGYAAK